MIVHSAWSACGMCKRRAFAEALAGPVADECVTRVARLMSARQSSVTACNRLPCIHAAGGDGRHEPAAISAVLLP